MHGAEVEAVLAVETASVARVDVVAKVQDNTEQALEVGAVPKYEEGGRIEVKFTARFGRRKR